MLQGSCWYTGDVTVKWTATDAESAITSSPCADNVLTTNSAATTFTCTATSEGGSATGSVTIKRDASTPVVTAAVGGTQGADGWYTSDVRVTWSAQSSVSPVSTTPCAAVSLTTDTGGVTYTCSATNEAGRSGTGTVTVKRDATRPAIGYSGNAGSYTVDMTVNITCAASDATSGLAANTCADITGPGYTFALGTTSFAATATDRAGNVGEANGSFTMGVSSSTVCTLVQRWSSSEGVANSLCGKLSRGDYAPFRLEVRAQSGKKITAEQATILLRLVDGL